MELLSVGMKALMEILAMETTNKNIYSEPFIPTYCVNVVLYMILCSAREWAPLEKGLCLFICHYISSA